MKSHATAATLVGAALLSAAAAVAQTPTTPGRAMKGTLIQTTVASTNVPAPVPITYYLPKNYDAKRAERYPLLIQLHGGGLSNKSMGDPMVGGGMGGRLDQAIESGLVGPMVSVMPSAARWFYMNFRDGSQKWEDFMMKDLLPYMRKNFNVVQGREGTFITGISMGGMGSLRMAVKYPEVFQAVASQEPTIEPVLAYDDITLRDKIGRPDGTGLQDRILLQRIYGDPIAPVNPPGSQPIAAPIAVVISGPMAPMTILSGDGSAICLPRSCRQPIQRERVLRYAACRTRAETSRRE